MAYAYACTNDKCLKMDYDTSHNPCHDCGKPTEPLYTATDIRKAWEEFAEWCYDQQDQWYLEKDFHKAQNEALRRSKEW